MRWYSVLYYSSFHIVLLHLRKRHEEEYAFGMHKTTQPPLYASLQKGDFPLSFTLKKICMRVSYYGDRELDEEKLACL